MGAPFPKIAERLRLFAFVEKPHDEIGRQSQALRTPFPKIAERLSLSAPPCRKWPRVSGCLHFLGAPAPKIGERLRLFALFYEICRPSQAVCIFWALHSRKLRDVSGYLHLLKKTHDEIGRQSQALRTPFPKIAERLRLSAPPC